MSHRFYTVSARITPDWTHCSETTKEKNVSRESARRKLGARETPEGVPAAYKIGEVIVTADSFSLAERTFNRPISTLELNQKQVNAIPQFIEPDLLRALQSLPGITPISDFSSALYVRGGTSDQNLYLIDGTEIYNPEHACGRLPVLRRDGQQHKTHEKLPDRRSG